MPASDEPADLIQPPANVREMNQPPPTQRIRRLCSSLTGTLVILACLCSTGCSTFDFSPSGEGVPYIGAEPGVMLLDPSETEETYNAVRQARSRNAVVLHVMGDSDPIRILPLPQDGKTVLISDLLRQSGVQKALKSIDVALIRTMPHMHTGHRMDVKMNGNGEQVRPETDYALRPGDRIQVAKYRADKTKSLIGAALGL
ncbi:MAG: hypothetical protein HKN47_15010 [Pirellulaceae bacterium]|nr:hypothetical protein [Pirellulaceae bacterium]